jgi:large subunit ribosomal protein L22
MPETIARLRHLRTSPTKVRQVLALIRGKDVFNARDILRFCDRAVALEVGKLLDSAIANAGHNDHVPEDELYVARAFADEGPTNKRWRPRARGRGTRIRKRTSHVTIAVARYAEDELARRRRNEAAGTGPNRGRPTRRRRPVRERTEEQGHEGHDHDHEDHDHDDEVSAEVEPKKATKRATRKATAEKATAEKAPAKKAPAKKAPAKKATKRQDEDD